RPPAQCKWNVACWMRCNTPRAFSAAAAVSSCSTHPASRWRSWRAVAQPSLLALLISQRIGRDRGDRASRHCSVGLIVARGERKIDRCAWNGSFRDRAAESDRIAGAVQQLNAYARRRTCRGGILDDACRAGLRVAGVERDAELIACRAVGQIDLEWCGAPG